MSATAGLGLLILGVFVFLMLALALVERRWPATFRPIEHFDALGSATERAVESGERVHYSVGTGSLVSTDAGSAFASLAMLRRVAEAATVSDRPPIVTAGDGSLTILGQDTTRSAYRRARATDRFHASSGRMLGPTPWSYAASVPSVLADENVSVNILVGSFGPEGALVADVGQRKNIFTLAGTPDIQAQSLLWATSEQPLIGEEVFAGGAYLEVNRMHRSSLRTQDLVRVLIIGGVLVATVLKTLGVIP
jgi:hypothetical protein